MLSAGNRFHSLHATSHALQPMHSVVSVKKPYFARLDAHAGGQLSLVGICAAADSLVDARCGTGAGSTGPPSLCLRRVHAAYAVGHGQASLADVAGERLAFMNVVFGSPTIAVSVLTTSPVAYPCQPKCNGMPTWWTRALADLERPHALGDQCLCLHFAAGGRNDHPVQVLRPRARPPAQATARRTPPVAAQLCWPPSASESHPNGARSAGTS